MDKSSKAKHPLSSVSCSSKLIKTKEVTTDYPLCSWSVRSPGDSLNLQLDSEVWKAGSFVGLSP